MLSAALLRVGPLPKRTQRQRRVGGLARRPYLPEAKSLSGVYLRVGPLPKRTQRQRRVGGLARRPYLPEAKS